MPPSDSPRLVGQQTSDKVPGEDLTGVAPVVATRAPRARMVRMNIGQTPDWDKIADDKVLEAWTASGGDVHEMAALLSGLDGQGNATFADVPGVPLFNLFRF